MTAVPGRFLLLGSGEFEPWSGEAERFALGGASGTRVGCGARDRERT